MKKIRKKGRRKKIIIKQKEKKMLLDSFSLSLKS
jgi:hypothetical protein